MRKLLTIGRALGLALVFAHGDALARGGGRGAGGQGGMRGGFGGGQANAGYQSGAIEQYRMQNRARAMQCPYGNSLGNGQQQMPYAVAPGQVPFGGQFGAMGQQGMQQQWMQQQWMQQQRMQQQRMQRRARAGQGGFGVQQAVPQAAQGQFGLGAGQCPFGNEPQALQQRNQVRARAGQNGAAAGSGPVQKRSRTRTRVPQ